MNIERIAYNVGLFVLTLAAIVWYLTRTERKMHPDKVREEGDGTWGDIQSLGQLILLAIMYGSVIGIPMIISFDFKGIVAGAIVSLLNSFFPDGGTFGPQIAVNIIRGFFMLSIVAVAVGTYFARPDLRGKGSSTWATVAPFLKPVAIMFIALSLIPVGDSTASGFNLLGLLQTLFSAEGTRIFTP